jgi:hypothetical protein
VEERCGQVETDSFEIVSRVFFLLSPAFHPHHVVLAVFKAVMLNAHFKAEGFQERFKLGQIEVEVFDSDF